jgi:hypothetical protein
MKMQRFGKLGAVASSLKEATSSVAKNIVFGAPELDFDDGGAEPLLDRLVNGVLPPDRRAAAAALRDLAKMNARARRAVALIGVKPMFETLRDTTDDDDLVRGTLEVLLASSESSESLGAGDDDGVGARDAVRRAIAEDARHIAQLVSELRGADFYSKLYAAQTLREASDSCGDSVRAGMLADPTAIPTLMDSMKENEVIRNEALLLLVELTKGNEELQKLVAFEGAFERAFSVMREEGGVDGGIVVQDCLELCNNLLRDNSSNQTLFRENGFVKSVPGLAAVEREIGGSGMSGMSAQKAANTLCALETVHLLVSPDEDREKRKHLQCDGDLSVMLKNQRLEGCKLNQSELAKHGMVEILVRASLGDTAVNAVSVRVAALRALAALVQNHVPNQTELFSATADRAGTITEPALLTCGRVALYSKSNAERQAAIMVLGSSMRGNQEGQLLLISTLAPTGLGLDDGSDESSLGGLLARALVSNGGSNVVFDEGSIASAKILRDMLHKNDQSKIKALNVNLEPLSSRSNSSELLLPRCVRQLAVTHSTEDEKPKVEHLQTVLLRLLIVWLYGCKPAVDAFLSSPGHLPAIADLARIGGSTQSLHVSALACVVLGCCLIENSGSVLDVVSARVGLQNFFMKWEAMSKSDLYSAASHAPTLPKPLTRANAARVATQGDGSEEEQAAPGDIYDHDITIFIDDLEERVKSSVMSLYAKPSGDSERIQSSASRRPEEDDATYLARLKQSLIDSEEELANVRARNTVLAEQLLGSSGGGASNSDAATDSVLRAPSNGALQAAVEAAKRASAQEIANLKAELADAKKTANERQESLTSLSTAYNGLEAEVYRLEAEAKSLREKLHDSANPGAHSSPDTTVIDAARDAGREEGRRLAEHDFNTRMQSEITNAVADADRAHEAELNDLLACLGQEEAHKEHLFEKLLGLGINEDELAKELAAIVIEEE